MDTAFFEKQLKRQGDQAQLNTKPAEVGSTVPNGELVCDIHVARPVELGGGEWVLTKLTGINAIFGKNGSGKSKLLRAWNEQNADSTHYVIW